jgi:hypothetical protein
VFFNRVNNRAHGIIEGTGHRVIIAPGLVSFIWKPVLIFFCRFDRRMNRVKRDVSKKWFVLIRIDEIDRFPGNGVRQVLWFDQRRFVSHDRAVKRLRRFGG